MGDAVVAALVAGVVSLLVTFGKVVLDGRRADQERRSAARERLDRYRAPLLAAVDDLGGRLNNIRNDGFLAYADDEDRRDIALQSTLFRFAQYLGWTEIVHGYLDRLRFESDEATRAVTRTLGDFGWILAADEFDRTNEDDFRTSQLMLWREEQRAIGELMRQKGSEARCLGFNSFATNYETRFARWFEFFSPPLRTAAAAETNRLAELQRVLARLIQQLDVDHVLVRLDKDGQVAAPRWARPSNLAEPPRYTKTHDKG